MVNLVVIGSIQYSKMIIHIFVRISKLSHLGASKGKIVQRLLEKMMTDRAGQYFVSVFQGTFYMFLQS